MYGLLGYEKMIGDKVRMDAYLAALRRAISPGCRVLEIGSGTGVMALLASQFGPRHVYSVEPSPAIAVARQIAQANGLSDRVTFIQGLSTRVKLPEKCDVIFSDLRGILPLYTSHLESIIHAREQHLAANGRLIPQEDTLWVALTDAPRSNNDPLPQWDRDRSGLDLSAIRSYLANTPSKCRVAVDRLLTEKSCWTTLNYTRINSSDVSGEVRLTCAKDGRARGLVLWFETKLYEEIGFSNAPGEPPAIYGMYYLPLLESVDVRADDAIVVNLSANAGDKDYVWQWETRFYRSGTKSLQARFTQSTFHAIPFTLESLKKGSDHYVPSLNDDGRIDRYIMGLMEGDESIGEIATKLQHEFSGCFTSPTAALDRVAELSRRYSS